MDLWYFGLHVNRTAVNSDVNEYKRYQHGLLLARFLSVCMPAGNSWVRLNHSY